MPRALLDAYAEALPAVRAGELLGLYEVIAAATGSFKDKRDGPRVIARLKKQAKWAGGADKSPPPPPRGTIRINGFNVPLDVAQKLIPGMKVSHGG